MDLWLPGKSGADLCQELKACPETQTIPVILCSAVTSPPDSIKNCADAWIPKPFDIHHFLRVVEKFG